MFTLDNNVGSTCIIFWNSVKRKSSCYAKYATFRIARNRPCERDLPFDIQGGLGFFLTTSYFFLSFCTRSFLIFLKNNTLKSEKCKREQHTE